LDFVEFALEKWQAKVFCPVLKKQAGKIMDPIADMLTALKNGYMSRKETVSIPFSWMKYRILKILEREGFVKEVKKRGKIPGKKTGERKRIVVVLKYIDKKPALHDAKRLSTPSRHLYVQAKEIHHSRKGGIIILSTPKGILTSQEAKKFNVGGELICEVW
jgi:small subunit ribosomal protein S8